MKKKLLTLALACTTAFTMLSGCGGAKMSDEERAKEVADLIDAIYAQERTDETDELCKKAKEAWDALSDKQKEMVEGENADPDYFGRDTGDASKDDPLNSDDIGENEILVVSFGTSFNDSRAEDISGVEKAIAAAYPDWSVRRAFTAQIIINHVQARDGEKIDNVDQALERAVANGVKNLVVQPTHLMHGAEYDELTAALENYADKFESVSIAEPLLGEVGSDATVINDDKKAVAEAVVAEAVASAGFDSLDAAEKDVPAFIGCFLQGNPVQGGRDPQIVYPLKYISDGFEQDLFQQFLDGVEDDVMLRPEDGDAGLSVPDITKGFQRPDGPDLCFLPGSQEPGSLCKVRCGQAFHCLMDGIESRGQLILLLQAEITEAVQTVSICVAKGFKGTVFLHTPVKGTKQPV